MIFKNLPRRRRLCYTDMSRGHPANLSPQITVRGLVRVRPIIAVAFRWAVYSTAVLLSLGVIILGVLVWQRPWLPYVFDDGPFTGRPAQIVPQSAPAQSYSFDRFTLITHDPENLDEAPHVLLKNEKGEVMWTIYAEGQERTKVKTVRFTDHRTLLYTTVRGTVNWTYGNETSWWIIDRSGKLISYYYSW